MGSVFKKVTTRPLPAGAESFTRQGVPMARWRDRRGKLRTARTTTGKDDAVRLLTESATYYARYRDHAGLIAERPTGCRDRQAAEQLLAGWERDAERIRAGVATPDELRQVEQGGRPIAEHFDAYDRSMQLAGVSDIHRTYTRRYLDRLAAECGYSRLADLDRGRLERWLSARQSEGAGAKTRNIYRGALVAFANWAVEHDLLAENPFKRVPVADVKADRRRIRRALTEDELTRLLDMARQRPLLDAQTVRRGPRRGERYGDVRPAVRKRLEALGAERRLIYKTLLLCGLRKAELTALTVDRLYLDDPIPCIRLDPKREKSREGSELYVRDDLAAELRDWLADKLRGLQDQARDAGEPIPLHLPGDTPLFEVPAGLLRIFNRDLRMAGIPKVDERGRTVDLHAMRTTLATLLSKGGVAPRTAQAVLRHSDIRLTMQTYTDPRLLDLGAALDALPALPAVGPTAERASGTAGSVTNHPEGARTVARLVAAPVAAPPCNAEKTLTTAGNGTVIAQKAVLGVTACADKRKDPLSSPDSGSDESGREDLNLRPHGPEPSSDAIQVASGQQVTTPAPSRCTPGCCETPPALTVDELAVAIRRLLPDDRTRLVALLLGAG